MNKKKNAHPQQTEKGASKMHKNTNTTALLSPRQARVLSALLETSQWISREAIDRIACASNGPEVIRLLRERFGYDCIEMQRIQIVDRDGKISRPGRYRLTDIGRTKLTAKGVK